ncbi:hypothetical protein B0H13DRAFT_2314461 [Mycena leptocephala]|nr:hypothetical protein B0H13DRAFT_2314461 [Mycena leptocephala]
MSPSARKDGFHVMGMHKIPPHLSKDEFETKLEALIDEAVKLPLVQRNLLKVEVIFQTDLMDEHVKAFGFPPREDVVFVEVQCETVENVLALVGDAEVQKLVGNGQAFALHSNSYGFSADEAVHLICVYNVPPHLSTTQHDQKFEAFIDNFVAIPAVRKNYKRFEMALEAQYYAGRPRSHVWLLSSGAYICTSRLENWNNALEMMTDPEAQQFVFNAGNDGEDFDLKKHGYVFTGRVVTKIDKAV